MPQTNTKDSHQPDEGQRSLFFALIGQHLKRLRRFVHHELAYHEAEGSLARGELSVDDVVDAVLLQAYETFLKDRNAARISRKHLVRLAINEIERAIKQSTFERKRTVHLEKPLPKTPPNEYVSTLGEEIMYFYTPDEALKVEDIIPDLEFPTPEEEAERGELRECVNRALADLPREWRRALLLRYIEEFDVWYSVLIVAS